MKSKQTAFKTPVVILSIIILASLVLAACNVPVQPTESVNEAVEHALQTLQAQATQDAFATMVPGTDATLYPTMVLPSQTQVVNTQVPPTNVPPTATQVPPVVIVTPIYATATRIPPTPIPVPCNLLKFVKDVTVPDGTDIVAGTSFTKTWRLRNVGSCTWTTEYDIGFVSGDQMSAPKFVDLPKAVKPGEEIDISIPMIAPASSGNYTGYWMLINQNGKRFGAGKDAGTSFWVDIDVVQGQGQAYSFTANACSAYWWSSQANPLSCPGKESDISKGYIIAKANPIREDGGKEDEPGLVVRPDDYPSGFIQGTYPAFIVKSGDKFKATIQCAGNTPNCDIIFELRYRIGSDPEVYLDSWHEISDNNWNPVEVDLSALAGKSVQFILTVHNGATKQDNIGLWLRPIIYRP